MRNLRSQSLDSEGTPSAERGRPDNRQSWSLRHADRRVAVILITAACSMLVGRFGGRLRPTDMQPLQRMTSWAGIQVVAYLILPTIVCLVFGIKLSEVGWSSKGLKAHWRPYAGLLFLALPAVVAVSFSAEFQVRYPLLRVSEGEQIDLAAMLIWWAFYAAQFVAVESFFRGFLVLGLAPIFGSNSVLIAMLPYLAIHFSKPPLEAVASIVGALVMGVLVLRSKSFWLGVIVHIVVAATMDVSSLIQKGVQW